MALSEAVLNNLNAGQKYQREENRHKRHEQAREALRGDLLSIIDDLKQQVSELTERVASLEANKRPAKTTTTT